MIKKFIKSLKENIYYPIWRFFSDVKTEIKNFPSNFLRGLKWFKRSYHSYDWDYNYLYKTIYDKLKDMERTIYRNSNFVNYKRTCVIMRYALHHLEYVIDDYKCVETLFDLHRKKFGNSKFLFSDPDKNNYVTWEGLSFDKCKTEEEREYADKVHTRINSIWQHRKEYHKKRFFYTFEKYIETWWD